MQPKKDRRLHNNATRKDTTCALTKELVSSQEQHSKGWVERERRDTALRSGLERQVDFFGEKHGCTHLYNRRVSPTIGLYPPHAYSIYNPTRLRQIEMESETNCALESKNESTMKTGRMLSIRRQYSKKARDFQ